MRIAFIAITYHTPPAEIKRLEEELRRIKKIQDKVFIIDNTFNNKGYAYGVNEGIRKGLKAGCNLFIVMNADVSLKGLHRKNLLEAEDDFDIWGLSTKQNEAIFYGGILDPVRLSGKLIGVRPKSRFAERDFISGSLMMIKKKVISKIGQLDENYRMYYEDVDYATRAKSKGFKVGVDTRYSYTHFENSKKTNKDKSKQLFLSRFRYFLKYADLRRKVRELFRLPKTIFEHRDIIISLMSQKRFLVNFLSINASSVINKFLNFILFLFLIRYLTPQDYGLYIFIWAQVNIFSPLLDMGTTSYGLVHLEASKKGRLSSLFSLRSFLAILIFGLTVFLGVIFRFNQRTIFFIILVSTVLFYNAVSGSYLIVTSVREKLIQTSGISVLLNLILSIFLILTIVVKRSLTFVFLAIGITYLLFTVIYSYLLNKEIPNWISKFNIHGWVSIIKSSYIYVLIAFFAGLYFKLDILLLKFIWGNKEVGVYSAGYKFFESMLFLAGSYNIAATPQFAKIITRGLDKLQIRVKRDVIFLALLALVVVAASYIFTFLVLPLILRGTYSDSRSVFLIVILSLLPILLSSVYLNAMYVMGYARFVILIFIVQTVINFSLNLLLIPRYSYWASAFITVFSELINFILIYLLYRLLLKRYRQEKAI